MTSLPDESIKWSNGPEHSGHLQACTVQRQGPVRVYKRLLNSAKEYVVPKTFVCFLVYSFNSERILGFTMQAKSCGLLASGGSRHGSQALLEKKVMGRLLACNGVELCQHARKAARVLFRFCLGCARLALAVEVEQLHAVRLNLSKCRE